MGKTGRAQRDRETGARSVLGSLSSHELARRCNLDPSHVSRILRGERKPSIGVAKTLAAALGMSLDELYDSLYPTEP